MLHPAEVEQRITTCLDEMETAVHELDRFAKDAAYTETDYKVAFAKERLRLRVDLGKVAQAVVDDHATVATESLALAYRIAANALTTQREALRALQARLDGLRTISASMRSVT